MISEARLARLMAAQWFARRDGCGLWVLVNEQGEQPLLSADPCERADVVHLARGAPEMLAGLGVIERQLQRMLWSSRWQHDEQLDELWRQVAWLILAGDTPPEIRTGEDDRSRGQRELQLEWSGRTRPRSWELWRAEGQPYS